MEGNSQLNNGDTVFEIPLREKLRSLRINLAKAEGRKAFHIFHNTVLDDIVKAKPITIRELMAVHGIGQRKADEYGQQILQVIRMHITSKKTIEEPTQSETASLKPTMITSSELRNKICETRLKLAKKERLPTYCVFDNKTLEEMVQTAPQTPLHLMKVKGIGDKRMTKYGPHLLQTINNHIGSFHDIEYYKCMVQSFLEASTPSSAEQNSGE